MDRRLNGGEQRRRSGTIVAGPRRHSRAGESCAAFVRSDTEPRPNAAPYKLRRVEAEPCMEVARGLHGRGIEVQIGRLSFPSMNHYSTAPNQRDLAVLEDALHLAATSSMCAMKSTESRSGPALSRRRPCRVCISRNAGRACNCEQGRRQDPPSRSCAAARARRPFRLTMDASRRAASDTTDEVAPYISRPACAELAR